jgi:hypothetical protein
MTRPRASETCRHELPDLNVVTAAWLRAALEEPGWRLESEQLLRRQVDDGADDPESP